MFLWFTGLFLLIILHYCFFSTWSLMPVSANKKVWHGTFLVSRIRPKVCLPLQGMRRPPWLEPLQLWNLMGSRMVPPWLLTGSPCPLGRDEMSEKYQTSAARKAAACRSWFSSARQSVSFKVIKGIVYFPQNTFLTQNKFWLSLYCNKTPKDYFWGLFCHLTYQFMILIRMYIHKTDTHRSMEQQQMKRSLQ